MVSGKLSNRTVEDWHPRDRKIVESKYVYPLDLSNADLMGCDPIEALIVRVTSEIAKHATEWHLEVAECDSVDDFAAKLAWIVRGQYATWNSPVWFNVGIQEKPQCWACLILDVEDNMPSILEWWSNEANCFLGGSGAGLNVSKIRADGEPLSSGRGTASGPLSFMRAADSIAGSIKSGGRTRRAAKMVILDVDHPDIEDFIESKVRVEHMKNVLTDAGFDLGLNGTDHELMQYQNANISVRVTDNFMDDVKNNNAHALYWRAPADKQVAKTVQARDLWKKIAQAAWECADPGMQFHDTINAWHTVPSRGAITASNPCSEYMSVCDSVCNLASLNLLRFFDGDEFDSGLYDDVVRTMIVSMDIIVDMSSYPNEKVEANSKGLRNLGLGYTNLGALLMSYGIGYDTVEGRSIAAALSTRMMCRAVRTSAELASDLGPHDAWETDRKAHMQVLQRHSVEPWKWKSGTGVHFPDVWAGIEEKWHVAIDLAEANGQRNSQLTVIAPTGTISFMLGAETTGIEPVLAIDAQKQLVGGGSIDVGVQHCVDNGLVAMGTNRSLIYEEIERDTDLVVRQYTPTVLKTLRTHEAFATSIGENVLRPEAHVFMMAAVQPSISGAISKTVMMPKSASDDDIANIYMLAWEAGLKSIAVYRDGSKGDQPVTAGKGPVAAPVGRETALTVEADPVGHQQYGHRQERMPNTRQSLTHKFTIDNQDFYLTVGYYPNGKPGEIFLKASAQGSFISGMCDVYSIAISLGLQHGVPLQTFAEHMIHQSFEPHGVVISDSDIKMARSVADYVWRWLMQHGMKGMTLRGNPLLRIDVVEPNGSVAISTHSILREQCPECYSMTLEFAGTCKRCTTCGHEEGCG